MSALKWGDVTTETPIDQLTAAATAAPSVGPAAQSTHSAADANAAAGPETPGRASATANAQSSAAAPSAPAPLTEPPSAPSSSAPPLPSAAPSAASPPPPAAAVQPPASSVPLDGGSGSQPSAAWTDPLAALASSLSQSAVSAPVEPADEEDPLPVVQWSGLHPGDEKAEVEVKNAGDSIYKAVASFEQLGLSPQLLAGVYELKFSSPSKIQAQALPVILAGKPHNKPGPNLIGQAHHGSGKCFARGTQLRLFNGDTKAVEGVAGGDELMGDDGTRRIVTHGSLIHYDPLRRDEGQEAEALYRITPHWDGAQPFTVNGAHILVLVNSAKPAVREHKRAQSTQWRVEEWEVTTDNRMVRRRRGSYDTPALAKAKVDCILAGGWEPVEWEVSVEEFLSHSQQARRQCMLTACKAITFDNRQLPSLLAVLTAVLGAAPSYAQQMYIAWWLGVWLADGFNKEASISQGGEPSPLPHHREEIFAELRRYQLLFNERVTEPLLHVSSAGWPVYSFQFGVGSVVDRVLRAYAMLNNKHIPRAIICDSVDVRRHVLAGLIDGDGYHARGSNTYEIAAKHRRVMDGCKELAATLGLRNGAIVARGSYVSQQSGEKEIDPATRKPYLSHRLHISGCMWEAVQYCQLTYKRCPQPNSVGYVEKNKPSRCYGFDVNKLDSGEYFGFTVDGNQRFLLADYTVTHNTATFSLGLLSLVDPSLSQPQAVVVVPTRELALQVASVISALAKHTTIQVYTAVPEADGSRDVSKLKAERVTAHVVVGTPGKLENKLKYRNIDSRNVKVFVADEADQMVAQEAFANTTLNIKKLLPRGVQILLFSATFDSVIRNFAREVAPNAVEIAVKTEELSLDSIKQFFVSCRSDQDKYATLTAMYGLLEIGQSIIFVHTVATAKTLANRMRGDGYTVSLLHGKDMQPAERDRVMDDFRAQKTTVLITTNVLARGIDVLSVTLVVNFDIPLNKYNKPDPETYIHRIGRSGRFGRKGVAINFVQDDKSKNDLAFIANHFQHDIVELPTNDMDKLSAIIQGALK